MTPAPIYDATAPVVCTITDSEIPEHLELLERMRSNLAAVDRTDYRVLLHFPPTDDNKADIDQFAIEEKRCCPFWGFDISTSASGHTLRWDGPPATIGFFDELHTYLTGNEPLAAFPGLL